MEMAVKVRTGLKAGQYGPPTPNGYGQYGWWWLSSGYIARPGRPMKQFTGWWYGGSPRFYYPAYGTGGGVGASPLGVPQGGGEGQTAPPAPSNQ